MPFSSTSVWLCCWRCDHQFRTNRRGWRSDSLQLDNDCFDSFEWFRWTCLQWINSDGVLHSHIGALYRWCSPFRYIRGSRSSQSNRRFPKCSLRTRRSCPSTVASERCGRSEWYRITACFSTLQPSHCRVSRSHLHTVRHLLRSNHQLSSECQWTAGCWLEINAERSNDSVRRFAASQSDYAG